MKRMYGVAAALSAAAVLLSGCSGTKSNNTALIRAVNAVPNGGQATIFINNGSANGSQNFLGTSAYLFVSPGTSSFTYLFTSDNGVDLETNAPLTQGDSYTALLVGRTDDANLPGEPVVLVVQDNTSTPPSGDAAVRVINTAIDAPNIDVLANGTALATDLVYPGESVTLERAANGIATSIVEDGGTPSIPYLNVPAGSVSIQVNTTGTSNALVAPTTINVSAGKHYTLLIDEPVTTPSPTFGISLLNDAT